MLSNDRRVYEVTYGEAKATLTVDNNTSPEARCALKVGEETYFFEDEVAALQAFVAMSLAGAEGETT